MKKTLLIALIIVFLISTGFFLINTFRNQNLKTDNNAGKSPPRSVSGNNPTPDEEDEDDYKGFIPTYINMDKKGASIIHTSRDLEQIKQYIANGGDVNERTLNGKTPLHLFRTQEIMEFLIKKGADINAIDMMGNTPVMSIAAWIEPPSTKRKDKSSQTPRKEDS
ncbi:MAG: hypothetical protein LWY06_19375, partial [Firmicutes bacterium]|nr:hypothetical protein [Bacillota bacterium]